jgi:hypothetical protein
MASALLSGAPPARRGAGHPRPDGQAEEERVAELRAIPGPPAKNAAAFSWGWGVGNAASPGCGDPRAGRPSFRGLLGARRSGRPAGGPAMSGAVKLGRLGQIS